jgi:hypothetical protein
MHTNGSSTTALAKTLSRFTTLFGLSLQYFSTLLQHTLLDVFVACSSIRTRTHCPTLGGPLVPERAALHTHCLTLSGPLVPERAALHTHCLTLSGHLVPEGAALHTHCLTLSGHLVPERAALHTHCLTLSGHLVPERAALHTHCLTLRSHPVGEGRPLSVSGVSHAKQQGRHRDAKQRAQHGKYLQRNPG